MSANRAEDAAKAYVSAYREVPSSLLALRQAAAWKVAGKPNEGMAVLADWLQRKSDDVGALVLASELDIAARRLPDAERRLRDEGSRTMICADSVAHHATGSSGQTRESVAAFHDSATRYYTRHVARGRASAELARGLLAARKQLAIARLGRDARSRRHV